MNQSLHLIIWSCEKQLAISSIFAIYNGTKAISFFFFLPAAGLAVLWSLKLKVTSHTLCACSALWCRSLFASQASSAVTLIHANLLFFPPPAITSSHSEHGASKQQIAANVQNIIQTRGLFVCLHRVRRVVIQSAVKHSPPHKTPLFIRSSSDIDDSSRSFGSHYHAQGLHQPTCNVKLAASVSAELILHNWVYNAGQFKEGWRVRETTSNLTGRTSHKTFFVKLNFYFIIMPNNDLKYSNCNCIFF